MDPLAKVYFMTFAIGSLFALLSWALAHVRFGHGHGVHHHHAFGKAIVKGGARRGAPLPGHGPAHAFVSKHLAPMANLGSLAALACVGGGVGTIALLIGSGKPTSLVLSVSSGIIAARAVGSLFTWLHKSSRYEEPLAIEGRLATVLSRIRANGVGEVSFARDGRRCVLPARGDHGSAIERGAEVIVLDMEEGIARVAPAHALSKEEEESS